MGTAADLKCHPAYISKAFVFLHIKNISRLRHLTGLQLLPVSININVNDVVHSLRLQTFNNKQPLS